MPIDKDLSSTDILEKQRFDTVIKRGFGPQLKSCFVFVSDNKILFTFDGLFRETWLPFSTHNSLLCRHFKEVLFACT